MPYLLLLLEERLLLLLPPLALARSLCALLFWVLALPPLLAACARLDFPEDGEDFEDEEEELRDAIACSLGRLHHDRPSQCFGHAVNLGRPAARTVGLHSPCA
jgi:hypothetical protein